MLKLIGKVNIRKNSFGFSVNCKNGELRKYYLEKEKTKLPSKDLKRTQKDVYSSITKYKKSRPFLISNDKLI